MTRLAPLGIALGAATVAGFALFPDPITPPWLALAGLVLLVVAGVPEVKLVARFALAAPGAALVGIAGDFDRPFLVIALPPDTLAPATWMAEAAAVVILVAAPLVADADARWARTCPGAGPFAFAIAAGGLFGCVPDTEEAWVLLVVAVAAAALSLLPLPRIQHLGAAGAMASTGVFVWIAAFDARGRPAAFVGAVTALGLLVWEPLGVRIHARSQAHVHRPVAMLAAHVALTAYASRVVGLEKSVGVAVALAVPAALAGIAAGALLGPRPE